MNPIREAYENATLGLFVRELGAILTNAGDQPSGDPAELLSQIGSLCSIGARIRTKLRAGEPVDRRIELARETAQTLLREGEDLCIPMIDAMRPAWPHLVLYIENADERGARTVIGYPDTQAAALAPFHEALRSGSLHEAAAELHALAETVAVVLAGRAAGPSGARPQGTEDATPANLIALIDRAADAADAARAAAEMLRDTIPTDHEEKRWDLLGSVMSTIAPAILDRLFPRRPPVTPRANFGI